MFTDDQFIGPNFEKSIFGNDDSGNIFNWDAEFLTELIQDEGKFDLITADGSLDCQVLYIIKMKLKKSFNLRIIQMSKKL